MKSVSPGQRRCGGQAEQRQRADGLSGSATGKNHEEPPFEAGVLIADR
jgi:hypothetical protein